MSTEKLFYKLPVVGWMVTTRILNDGVVWETTPLLSSSGTQGEFDACHSYSFGRVEKILPAQPGTFLVLFRREHDPYYNPRHDDQMPTQLGLQHPCDQLNDSYWQKEAEKYIEGVKKWERKEQEEEAPK